jgi:hypothetical protein
MALRFQRRINLGGGFSLNLGKRSASVSVGGRGHHVTVGTHGTSASAGIPGTGISYRRAARITARRGGGGIVSTVLSWMVALCFDRLRVRASGHRVMATVAAVCGLLLLFLLLRSRLFWLLVLIGVIAAQI